jgi:NAD(P)-dependent dehydrogenase (short-subunit alcohol dehydrogenase family)
MPSGNVMSVVVVRRTEPRARGGVRGNGLCGAGRGTIALVTDDETYFDVCCGSKRPARGRRRYCRGVIGFDGQAVVVTGGGRGLGRLYALDFARRGAAVVVNDLGVSMAGDGADTRVAGDVVEEIRAAGGVAVASYDSVDTPEGGAAIVERALEEFGRLDAVVSNAGIFHTAPFDELTFDDWQRMLRVHLNGAFNLSQPAYRHMKDTGGGRFVFIASSAGLFGQPNSAHYAAAKAGILGLANVIAVEGAPHGILANCVLPFGYSRMVFETVGEREQLEPDPGFLHAIEPELVVPVVVYLASTANTLSHHNFSACAGRFARVFVGLSDGWVADTSTAPTADDIAENLDAVVAAEPYTIPGSIFDEVNRVCTQLGIS